MNNHTIACTNPTFYEVKLSGLGLKRFNWPPKENRITIRWRSSDVIKEVDIDGVSVNHMMPCARQVCRSLIERCARI